MRGLTLWHTSDSIAQEDDGGAGAAPKAKGMFSAFTNLVSGKILDEDDLDPVLRTVKESLIAKNVAVDIAGECARAQRFPYSLRKSKSKKRKRKQKQRRARRNRGEFQSRMLFAQTSSANPSQLAWSGSAATGGRASRRP